MNKEMLQMMAMGTNSYLPMVIQTEGRSERAYDLYSRLMKERIIFLNGPVEDNMANIINASLLYLEAESAEKDIYMYINSPGGSVTAGLSIYDTMLHVKPTVHTVCMGQACSMGAFLLSAGDKRSSMRSARIMIHQPLGGYQGQATDMEIHMEEMKRIKTFLTQVLAANTNKPYEKVRKDCERDNFMSAYEALEYGLIDEVLDFSPREGDDFDYSHKRRPDIPALKLKGK